MSAEGSARPWFGWLLWVEPLFFGSLTLAVLLNFAAQWLLIRWREQDLIGVSLLATLVTASIALFVLRTPSGQRVYRSLLLVACVGLCAAVLQAMGFTLPGLLGLE